MDRPSPQGHTRQGLRAQFAIRSCQEPLKSRPSTQRHPDQRTEAAQPTFRSCHEQLMGRPLTSARKPVPRPRKVCGGGGGPPPPRMGSRDPWDNSTRMRLPKKS